MCGRGDPTLFAFSLADCVKTPLCKDDVKTFLSSASSEQVLISILCYSFVNTLSDGHSHLQHYQRLSKALTFCDSLLTRARQNAENLSDSIEALKKSTLELITSQFDQMNLRLLDFHASIERKLEEVKTTLDQGRFNKLKEVSGLAQTMVTYAELDKGYNVYRECFQDCTADIKRAAQRTIRLGIEDPAAYLEFVVKGDDFRPSDTPKPVFKPSTPDLPPAIRAQNPYKQNGPSRGYPVPDTYKPPAYTSIANYRNGLKNCEICHNPLTATNSILAPNHESCFFCFNCLKNNTHTYIRCPICRAGFNPTIRKSLEDRIPGLIKVQSKKRLRRMGYPLDMACSECDSTELYHAHKCQNGDIVCLTCCQCSLIMTPQPKPGRCPRCYQSFGTEVYTCFREKRHQCEGCGCALGLENAKEYVRDRFGVKYYCQKCKEGRSHMEYPLE